MVSFVNDSQWNVDKIAEQKWHYVSWTPYSIQSMSDYADLSWVYAICWLASKLSQQELCSLFQQIDSNGETGTFYPTANITIMPSRKYRVYSPEQYRQHMDDVKKAQQLINAEHIYWDCRFEDADNTKAVHLILITDEYWEEKNNYIIVNDRKY